MTRVEFTDHGSVRLHGRKVEDVAKTLQEPDELFEDVEARAMVAIKKLDGRHLVVVYHLNNETYRVVTLYYAGNITSLVHRKVSRGAWRRVR